jgi:hypothetical protein
MAGPLNLLTVGQSRSFNRRERKQHKDNSVSLFAISAFFAVKIQGN